MSPILVRPVREQLEHDRVIRLLQQDLAKKKVDVGINPGAEQNASVGGAGRKEFPDAVLYSTEKGRKLIGVVEVETAESVNHLEAMSQWAHLAKLRVPFHLYVPTASADAARRLSEDHRISVTEIWSYHQVGEQFKFTLIHPPARGRSAAPAPRTVSVAIIRVEPRVDPTAGELPEEPAAKSAPIKAAPAGRATPPAPKVASEAASPRVVPAKPRVIPAKTAVAGAVAKPSVAKPGKPLPSAATKSAPMPAARPAKATEKAAAGPAQKAAPAKATPVKATSVKVVAPKAKAPRPARKATSRPAAGRSSVPARKAATVRKTSTPPSAGGRAAKSKSASARKPASKRR